VGAGRGLRHRGGEASAARITYARNVVGLRRYAVTTIVSVMWYAAKLTNRGAIARAMGQALQPGDPLAAEPRRVFLRRSSPFVSTELKGGNDLPSYGAVEFDSRAAAIDAARVIAGPGRRVAVPVAPCPHGCGPLDWADDSYRCRRCGDEWDYETVRGYPLASS